ncbi:hypothetical protein Asi02nite_76300 [Asanoa siamensis]|uniref:Uncharacterized protein n=1 Tax=Asanoa siamensis TaxID=926357 RepID=A0ABQ4D4S1_9ACTN|nr:hypothetical protein Asi02nite_76300 [Asanoa siamensis]
MSCLAGGKVAEDRAHRGPFPTRPTLPFHGAHVPAPPSGSASLQEGLPSRPPGSDQVAALAALQLTGVRVTGASLARDLTYPTRGRTSPPPLDQLLPRSVAGVPSTGPASPRWLWHAEWAILC